MFQELPLLEHSNEEISIQTVKVLKKWVNDSIRLKGIKRYWL